MLAILFFAFTLNAQDIKIGKPLVRGSGCESASAEINSQNKSVNINFKNFKATAGKSTSSLLARKTCLVAIPVQVDKGMQISVVLPKVLAQVNLNKNSTGHISIESFFVGSKGTRAEQDLVGPIEKSILVSNTESSEWTQCGVDTNLRFNLSIVAQVDGFDHYATVAIESLAGDVQIKTKRCN